MDPKPGEVWLAALGLSAKTRPNEVMLPKLRFLEHDSTANAQGLGSLPKVRLERRLGKLPDDIMKKIKRAITFTLDL